MHNIRHGLNVFVEKIHPSSAVAFGLVSGGRQQEVK